MNTKTKKWMVSAVVLGALAVGQTVFAAQDPLMLPEDKALLAVTEMQIPVTVETPNWEVKQIVDTFAQYGQDHHKQLFALQTNQVISAGQLDVKNALFYMNVRKNFYIESHRWKKDSYGRVVLNRLFEDYQSYLQAHTFVQGDEVNAYKEGLLDILERHSERVHNNELRTYMNEMVIFGLEQAMKDHNPSVQVYQGQ